MSLGLFVEIPSERLLLTLQLHPASYPQPW